MVSDIALSILSHLEREGCHFNADILESVCEAYQQAAADFDIATSRSLTGSRSPNRVKWKLPSASTSV